jgi:hypothetical protein
MLGPLHATSVARYHLNGPSNSAQPTAWTRPWASDAAFTGGCEASQERRVIRIQGYLPRKPPEGPVSPSERRFENTLMDEGRFAKKGGSLVDRSRLVQELPEHYPSGCRTVSLGPSTFLPAQRYAQVHTRPRPVQRPLCRSLSVSSSDILSCTLAHIYSHPLMLWLPLCAGAGKGAIRGSIGPVLRRILQMDFGEFLFHALC